ncbi:rhodanese-like domain-containing protein [Chryseobacterium sp. 09-1422]|uniref:Rhodanese-like domain-containing protein n=1 Tax=Chryseobacterium kimseyorum TaxID=2984028 RepID=A0ABT3I0B9_9FLAO|nr:rhodanese-like domain-containing protein [Chryseobacterium kimseyorum]MCW3169385.1 rhodanese-like domain-containing protein [Chryseobacterium kimseyorum]
MKTFLFGIILAAFFSLNACKTAPAQQNIAKTNIIELVKDRETILVDVRIPEQYAEGTAKDAINIPLAEIQNKAESLKGKKVVVFCNKGIQADHAVEILRKNGIEVV